MLIQLGKSELNNPNLLAEMIGTDGNGKPLRTLTDLLIILLHVHN